MRKSGLTLLFALTFVLTAAVIIQELRFDHAAASTRESSLVTDRAIGDLTVAIADFRAAQTGYLATGQGPDFWMRRASEIAAKIETRLGQLRATSPVPEAVVHYAAAADALADVVAIDGRARESLGRDQRFLASDLIFMEGLEASQRVSGELAAARATEMRTAELSLSRISRLRLSMHAFALAAVVLVAIYAGRANARTPAPSPAAAMAQMLRELPPPVKPSAQAPLASGPPPPPAPAVRIPTPASIPASSVSLPEAADLCVDLARVIDGRDIPDLLERTARLLEAKGLIIWVSDREGQTLQPSLTHGYSEKMLTRLGALDVAAENATSLSFRSMRPQSVNGGTPGAAGAIAVPLVTAAGCTGVLTAEVKDSTPGADVIALAKIFAAQFATLIAPGESNVHAAEA